VFEVMEVCVAVATPVTVRTWFGLDMEKKFPSPLVPFPPSPQHLMAPVVSTAQPLYPIAICETPLVRPVTCTGVFLLV
jgi:hypothetical protein